MGKISVSHTTSTWKTAWHVTAAQQTAVDWADIMEHVAELFIYLNFFSVCVNLQYLSADSLALSSIIAEIALLVWDVCFSRGESVKRHF